MDPNDSDPEPDEPISWNPITVRDLVRAANAKGRRPARLHLGQREAEAYHRFLSEAFGEDALISVRNEYYLGMVVVEEQVPSTLRLEGHKGHDEWVGRLPPLWNDGEADFLCA